MNTISGMVVDSKAPVYDYKWLCQMMQERKRVSLVLRNPHSITIQGIINGVRPEDGSGKSWLVTICDNATFPPVYNEVYVRTL